jgi:hypothetical protein
MFEDLRALRNSLQNMPRQKLDANFAERVLKAAQARKNGDRPADLPIAVAKPIHEVKREHLEPDVRVKSLHHGVSSVAPAQHEPIAWRVAVWSIAGIAAALLVALALPERTSDVAHLGNKNLPQGPATKSLDFKAKELQSPKLKRDDAAALQEQKLAKEIESAETPHDHFKPGELAKPRAEYGDSREQESKQNAGAAPALTRDADAGKTAEESPAPPKPATAAAPGAPNAFRESPDDARGRIANDGNGGDKYLARRAMKADAKDARLKQLEAAAQTNETLIVRLTVPAEKFQQRAIDQVIADAGLLYANADAETADKKAEGDREGGIESANAARVRPAESALADAAAFRQNNQRVDVVVVEASLEQVRQVMDGLEAQTVHPLALDSLDANARKMFDNQRGGGGFGGGSPGGQTFSRNKEPGESTTRKDEEVKRADEFSKQQAEKAALGGAKSGGFAMRIAPINEAAKKSDGFRAVPGPTAPPPPPAPEKEGEQGGGRGAGRDSLAKSAKPAGDAAAQLQQKVEGQRANELRANRRVRVLFVIEPEAAPASPADK